MVKHSAETKIAACEDYLSGKKKVSQLCRELGLSECNAPGCFWNWVRQYEKYGKEAFTDKRRHTRYTKEFKQKVVQAYIDGEGSFGALAVKYGISTDDIIRCWYKNYLEETEKES